MLQFGVFVALVTLQAAHAAPSTEQWRQLNSTALRQQCAYGTPNNGCPKGQHCWSGSCRCDCAAGPKAPCTMPPCTTANVSLPCDTFAKGGTPCVAAHSMTRALYATYAGPLYQLKKGTATKDISVVSAGGVADGAAHAAFCGTVGECVLQKIYDQSPLQNHLGIEHGAPNLSPPRNYQDTGVNFTEPGSKTTLGGKPVHAAFFVGDSHHGKQYVGQGYSNRTAKGTAVGDEPQTSYALFSGKHYNDGCCFDYGNAENITADGKANVMADGTMEAVYFGSGYAPKGKGSGSGPWIGADMENGIYEGSSNQASVPSLKPADFIAGFVKGKPGNHYSIKAGDPASKSLDNVYDGPRPKGYETMKKQGAIILGIGGDNSPWAAGTFYEGAMTYGYATDETEQAVFANIVAAGYGK